MLARQPRSSECESVGEKPEIICARSRDDEKTRNESKTDLFARIPHGTGQTILREALLVADHTAYHLGQVILVRRLFGAWKQD